MSGLVPNLESLFVCLAVGTVLGAFAIRRNGWRVGLRRAEETPQKTLIATLIRQHFHPVAVDDVTISERKFPFRVRADLQRAIDRLFGSKTTIQHFWGVRQEIPHQGLRMGACIVPGDHNPPGAVPPQY